MPNLDPEQKKIVRLIKAEGQTIKNRKVRRLYMNAAVQTGLVESGLHNLSGGDADSEGWRQERASLYKDPRNLRASIRRFKDEFLRFYDPGEHSYEVAAQVQRPAAQYRGRYADRAGEARQVLGQVAGATGVNSGSSDSGSPGQYTIPGVDNSQLRQQAKLSYLQQRGKPGALLELKAGLDAAQDVPSETVRYGDSQSNRTNPGKTAKAVKGELYELFWNGPGATNVKNGQRVQKGFVSGHTDHVHVGAKQKDILKIGRIAQQMGLHVGENPAFGGVDPVHVGGSFHYGRHEKPGENDRAIDVSGDPVLMRKFASKVARLYGL